MKIIVKSLLIGILGASLFFSFFMMISIAGLALVDRLHGSVEATSVVVTPVTFLRHVGLPLSICVFALSFAFGWRRFRHPNPTSL